MFNLHPFLWLAPNYELPVLKLISNYFPFPTTQTSSHLPCLFLHTYAGPVLSTILPTMLFLVPWHDSANDLGFLYFFFLWYWV
jgi:hypothetical protein